MSDLVDSIGHSLAGNNSRGFFGLLISVIMYVVGGITYLLPVLVILMLIDYFVGIASAVITGEKFSVKIALLGILKKTAYLSFIVFAQLLDAVVIGLHSTGVLNVENFRYFGLIVNVYLIGTEGVSILKNLSDCGVPMPGIFRTFFEHIAKIGDKKGD